MAEKQGVLTRMVKLDHLSLHDHEEAAKLLKQIDDDLTALKRIVQRAPFTDAAMRVQKRIQETLTDPLREALDQRDDVPDEHRRKGLYPSAHYSIRR